MHVAFQPALLISCIEKQPDATAMWKKLFPTSELERFTSIKDNHALHMLQVPV
jgi:hypothetical protein